MSNIVPHKKHALDIGRQQRAKDLLEDWWKEKSENTRRGYKESLEEFRKFCEAETIDKAVSDLVKLDHGEANHVALRFKNWMKAKKAKPNTVNVRLATLRSMVKSFNTAGLCPWTLSIRSEKAVVYRDTAGPGADAFDQMLAYAAGQKNKTTAKRDYAILMILGTQAHRRHGVSTLDVEHVDFKNKCAWILLKGSRVDRTRFTWSDQALAAVKKWIGCRKSGPLFPGRAGGTTRLADGTIWAIVNRIGNKCGLKVHPHSLRHSGITTALELTKGDVRAVMKYSGHRNVSTLMIYDDARTDGGGEVARKVGKRHGKNG